MVIKKIKQSEYHELMQLMNASFNFTLKEDKFEHILPKLYYYENTSMIHYGVYEENKLVASIGLYPMTLCHKNKKLNIACLGAVSTHPNYRLKGYFKVLMKKMMSVAKKEQYDLVFLGGNRIRYSHFGFENAGRTFIFNLTNRCKANLHPQNYQVEELNPNHFNDIQACLALYSKQEQHLLRTKEDFYNHLISWNCIPYIVKVDGNIVGYYCIKENQFIYELIFQKEFKDSVFDACIQNRNEVIVYSPMSLYNKDTLKKIDWFRVEHNEMYRVFNWKNVANYMNFDVNYEKEFNKFTVKERIIKGLGDGVNSSLFSKISIYIGKCDQG